jgi:hypothetical protein
MIYPLLGIEILKIHILFDLQDYYMSKLEIKYLVIISPHRKKKNEKHII